MWTKGDLTICGIIHARGNAQERLVSGCGIVATRGAVFEGLVSACGIVATRCAVFEGSVSGCGIVATRGVIDESERSSGCIRIARNVGFKGIPAGQRYFGRLCNWLGGELQPMAVLPKPVTLSSRD